MEVRDVGTNTGDQKTVYAWLSIDENGKSGLIGTMSGAFVFSNLDTAQRMRPIVREVLNQVPNHKARLHRYTISEFIEELETQPAKQ